MTELQGLRKKFKIFNIIFKGTLIQTFYIRQQDYILWQLVNDRNIVYCCNTSFFFLTMFLRLR